MGAWVPDPPRTLPCWEEKTGGGRGGARRVTEEKGEGEERGEPRRGAAEAEGSSGSEPLLPPVSALSASRGPNQSLESPGGAEGLLFAQGSLVLKAGFPHISSITWGQTCRFPPVFPPRRPARASGGFWCLVEGGPDAVPAWGVYSGSLQEPAAFRKSARPGELWRALLFPRGGWG